jgi:ribonuclease-3
VSATRERLQQALGYQFKEPALLEQALTHRSRGAHNNERLEFLGDSILNHFIAEQLFLRFPEASEGDLSQLRAVLVRGDELAVLARELDLGEAVLLGPGERKSGGRRRNSILADALEAVIGAMLLDGGFEVARERVQAWFAGRLDAVSPQAAVKDAKTSLQEYLQGKGLPLPDYALVATEGADHCQQFTVECRVAEPPVSERGTGSSRRRAEQAAAGAVLEVLDER